MLTCPECGAANAEGVKFCDRCGQGLAAARTAGPAATSALPPLPLDTELKGGWRIVELIDGTAHENRYRAERRSADGGIERVQLRERAGGSSAIALATEPAEETGNGGPNELCAEDPAGPHAKTADLKLKNPPAAGAATVENAATGGLETAAVESSPAAEPETEKLETDEPQPSNGKAGAKDEIAAAAAGSADGGNGAGAGASGDAATAIPLAAADEVSAPVQDDLGEVFGRVMALSMTLNHPALQRALEGFADRGRVYLAYRDERLVPLSRRAGGLRMGEAEAIAVAIQVCQAIAFVNRRGLRVNDICPDSVAFGDQGRIRLTGLECISNDIELQAEPLINDGYSAPEIYKGRKVDKRADVFSAGALLYTCLTGERIEAESWREEAGPIRFYPPHVVSPMLEQAVRRALLFDPAARWASVDALKAELVRLAGIIRLRAAVLTDVGMVRELNEDSVLAAEFRRDSLIEPAQNFLYVVADGMGGAEAGEMASAIAVGAIHGFVETALSDKNQSDRVKLLPAALEEANRKILEYQNANVEARGMGSTAVGALIEPPEAVIAWVGDSRAYFQDGNGLRQLTKDHSLVQRLIEIGQLTAEEARHHEHKNVITRSLGARQSGPAGAEAVAVRLKRGDRLLLCSDGLTAHVDDASIGSILRRHADPDEAARELVVAANAGGGTDNVSVVVIFAD